MQDNQEKTYKLKMMPVPDSCWYSNLRSALPAKIWDIIRKDAYARANGRCMICGRHVNRLEAHEKWSYDEENQIQKLDDILAVCHECHSVIHIGRTQLFDREEQAIAHFCRVNNCTYADYRRELGKANEYHKRLNQVSEWKLDVSFIKDILDRKEKKKDS